VYSKEINLVLILSVHLSASA